MATSERSWMIRAACRGQGLDTFFPEQGQPSRRAKTVCQTCPVSAACLAYGLGEEFGVWGGRTRFERLNALRRHDPFSRR